MKRICTDLINKGSNLPGFENLEGFMSVIEVKPEIPIPSLGAMESLYSMISDLATFR
jgi:hypothetical protein